jgi:tetratricopeptide (TPR) repeat protein
MKHEHLDAEMLGRLLNLDRTEDQTRSLLHQIAVCEECRRVGGWLLELYESGALSLQFGIVEVALARSRAEAPRLFGRLTALSPEQRASQLRTSAEFASWGLAELLGRESRQVASQDSAWSLELAELAVSVADRLDDVEPFEPYWVYQLRALAWAYLGNAQRVAGNLPAAEQAFETVKHWWDAGTESLGDVLGYGPVLLDLEASLRIAQRRFEEALGLLEQVAERYLTGDSVPADSHLAGRALASKAMALIEMGEKERAVGTLKEAERLVDAERDPRLAFSLRHNLMDYLSRLGSFQAAGALLPQVQELAASHGSRLDQLRVRWVGARITAGLGERTRGRQGLAEVRRELLGQGIVYDAALVTLEIAVLSIEEGDASEVEELAAEMVAVFRAQGVPREALAALVTLQRAAARKRLTLSLARDVAAVLEHAKRGERPRI